MTFVDYSEENIPAKDQNNISKNKSPVQDDLSQWGYDLYPDRRKSTKNATISDYLQGKGKENIEKIKCERNVYKCIKESPLVKLMMGALKASGCAVDIRRHISCEECAPAVSGGYDPILNQVSVFN